MKRLLLKHRTTCRGCESKNLVRFLDLGKMPLAGGFLDKNQVRGEKKFPLQAHFCRNCGLVQVLDVIDPKALFEKYFYSASVIPSLSEHFRQYAEFLKKTYLKNEGTLLEFGANDGVLLQYFKDNKKISTLGIDPSKNVTKLAKRKGLNIITDYFNEKSARKIKEKYGKMDVVTGSNVFAHVDDIHQIIRSAKLLLKPEGVFIVEVHYLKDLIKDFQYETIYHEHLSYYSARSLKKIFELSGLRLIDVMHLDMHGGGLRAVAAFKESKRRVSSRVNHMLKGEIKYVMERTLIAFGKRAKEHRSRLRKLLHNLKSRGYSIVGYGAPGRGTILLNYCGLDEKYLDYIVDLSPLRSGKFMPGVHVPIVFPEKARENPPDYFLVLAWNYAKSILKQEKELLKRGVKFIIPFPTIRIISK